MGRSENIQQKSPAVTDERSLLRGFQFYLNQMLEISSRMINVIFGSWRLATSITSCKLTF